MRRIAIVLVVCLLVTFTAGAAFAFMKGERVFETKKGAVTFSIDKHKARGDKCASCHDAVAPKKKGGLEMKFPHKDGCTVCLDGTRAP